MIKAIKNDWQETLQIALRQNKDCKIGILLSKRIFYLKQKNKQEALVVLFTDKYGDVFGHIFQLQSKWISCLFTLNDYPVGKSDETLIKNFWLNLNSPLKSSNLNIVANDNHMRQTDSFGEAIVQLTELIQGFNKETFHWQIDEARCEIQYIYWEKAFEVQNKY